MERIIMAAVLGVAFSGVLGFLLLPLLRCQEGRYLTAAGGNDTAFR